MRRLILGLFLLFSLLVCGCTTDVKAGQPDLNGGSVVLASPENDYYSLAEEISRADSAPLVYTWEAALAQNPDTVLWVVSPDSLSDEIMIKAGQTLRRQAMLPAIGIITGKTQAEARALWQRGRQVGAAWQESPPDRFFAANAEYSTAGIPRAQLIAFQNGQPETARMDLDTLVKVMQRADYLTFTGHGSDSYWRLDQRTVLKVDNLPDLPPLVATSNGCQTLRPWEDDSIALGFTGNGAAAYGGFVYSPLEGFMPGGFQDLPFRNSWPGFTIGLITSLQNRGTMQGFAAFPFYYLLGDARLAFRSAPPYELATDVEQEGIRTLTYRGAPTGMIPVRVEGGGQYHYVGVVGVADTADGDPFFNSRLQAASLNGDKFILFKHGGGDFTVQLRSTPPWHWWIARTLLAAFDHVSLFNPMNGGGWLVAGAGVIFAGIAVLRWRRVREREEISTWGMLRYSTAAGLGVALVLGVYQVWRLPITPVTTKPLSLDVSWLLGVFLLTVSASILYLTAHQWTWRFAAVLIAALPALLPAVFSLAVVGVTNLLIAGKIGAPVYNYQLSLIPLTAAMVWSILSYNLFSFLKKRSDRQNY